MKTGGYKDIWLQRMVVRKSGGYIEWWLQREGIKKSGGYKDSRINSVITKYPCHTVLSLRLEIAYL